MERKYPGVFIAFEGPEGGGKTAITTLIGHRLRHLGVDVVRTREPGGTLIGDQVREVLRKIENTRMLPKTEVLLFQAIRAQHIGELVIPSLIRGSVVLCDRYVGSTKAYQGYGYRMDLRGLQKIINYATGGLEPDMTLLLDLDVEEGLRRKQEQGEWTRIDANGTEFHQRVRDGYLKLAKGDGRKWKVVDASQDISEVEKCVWFEVGGLLRSVGMLGLV